MIYRVLPRVDYRASSLYGIGTRLIQINIHSLFSKSLRFKKLLIGISVILLVYPKDMSFLLNN